MAKLNKDTEIVKSYLEEFPDKPIGYVLEKVVEENPWLLDAGSNPKENIRSKIRYYRGKMGKIHRKKRGFDETGDPKEITMNEIESRLPDSNSRDHLYTHYHLPNVVENIDIISDLHGQYYCKKSFMAYLGRLKDKKDEIDAVVINGDLLDLHRLNRKFRIHGDSYTAEQECEMADEWFALMREVYDGLIYYQPGNHEVRYEHYLGDTAPDINCRRFVRTLPEALRLDEHNITYLPYERYMVFQNECLILHGDTIPSSDSQLRQRHEPLVAISHLHRFVDIPNKHRNILTGKKGRVVSSGCICEIHPRYRPESNWDKGFLNIRKVNTELIPTQYKFVDGVIYKY